MATPEQVRFTAPSDLQALSEEERLALFASSCQVLFSIADALVQADDRIVKKPIVGSHGARQYSTLIPELAPFAEMLEGSKKWSFVMYGLRKDSESGKRSLKVFLKNDESQDQKFFSISESESGHRLVIRSHDTNEVDREIVSGVQFEDRQKISIVQLLNAFALLQLAEVKLEQDARIRGLGEGGPDL